MIRWLHLASGVLATGALAFLLLTAEISATHSRWRGHLLNLITLLLALFLVTGTAVLALQVATAIGRSPLEISLREWLAYAVETRYGNVWLLRHGVAAMTLVLVIFSPPLISRGGFSRFCAIALALMVVAQGAIALAGHGAVSDHPWLAAGAHAVHMVAASIWLGGLSGLMILLFYCRRAGEWTPRAVGQAFQSFSELALAAMVLIVMSGIVIAALQIQRWPGLFGTDYGERLLIKLSLFLFVLAAAAHLRWRGLKTIEAHIADRTKRSNVLIGIAIELLFALAVMWMAATLAVTPPAQHDQILWPFAFRIAPGLAWPKPEVQAQVWWGLAIIAAGLAWTLWSWRHFGLRLLDNILFTTVAALGLWIAIPPLIVPAFPDTYRRSSVPYQSLSITNGERLFKEHCVGCHGMDATGNGPIAKSLAKPPADLTAPHAGDHTPGDMFWRLTHGIPGGGMPAFPQLSDEDRWDVVNFVHSLATGYQARIIRERIVSMRPWLGAPDFNYVASDGSSGSLKDFREQSSVLLVLFGDKSNARLEQLDRLSQQLMDHNVRVLAAPLRPDIAMTTKRAFPILTEGAEDVSSSYQLLRRTIENPRAGERGPLPRHMEFLIDRYGYLRARWLPEDTEPGWRDEQHLLAQAEQLTREPRLKPPPDQHLH